MIKSRPQLIKSVIPSRFRNIPGKEIVFGNCLAFGAADFPNAVKLRAG
jgi:hypothetical protein